jgi:hypothetical protein
MNTPEAIEFLRDELSRARLLSYQPLDIAVMPPTRESLITGEAPFTEEEADEFLTDWDPEEEARSWHQRRDRCSALTMAIAALSAMNELPGELPEFTYEPPTAGEVVADLVARLQKRQA